MRTDSDPRWNAKFTTTAKQQTDECWTEINNNRKGFLWRTIWCCTFSKSVNQLDSQLFTQSRGQSVDRWRVSQSVGLSVS